MLVLWPFVGWQLWTRLDHGRALLWTVLGGYLLLPPLTAFNFPVIPDLDKVSIPNLTALFCAMYVLGDRISFLPDSKAGKLLLGIYVFSPFATVLTNSEPLFFQQGMIQGMRIYDSAAAVINQAIVLLPFFLARRYLGTPEGCRIALLGLVVGGLAYSIPMMIEARFSPQINVWVYGFFQHDFFQTIRFGGYRPVVFLQHGLWVAFFTLTCFLAAVVFARDAAPDARPRAVLILVYLAAMLVLCKSAGPAVYAAGLVPLLVFASWRVQLLVAAGLACIVLIYPLLRGANLVPLEAILHFAEGFSTDRAYSLQFRIENEEMLLAHANVKPWFGWGGYGRNFLHNPVTGEMMNIADGAWIITLGIYGWFGFIAEFGLTALPLLALGREAFLNNAAVLNRFTAGLALILAANMLDLLPNATHIPFTWLMVGALLGDAERMARVRLGLAPGSGGTMHPLAPKRTVI